MDIVKDVKAALHSSGIHSGTVQPEFGSSEDTKVFYNAHVLRLGMTDSFKGLFDNVSSQHLFRQRSLLS